MASKLTIETNYGVPPIVSPISGVQKIGDNQYLINDSGTMDCYCLPESLIPGRNGYCKGIGVPEYSQNNNSALFYFPTNSFYIYGYLGCQLVVTLTSGKTVKYTIPKNYKKAPYILPVSYKRNEIRYYEIIDPLTKCIFTYDADSKHCHDHDGDGYWLTGFSGSVIPPELKITKCEQLEGFTRMYFQARATAVNNVLTLLTPSGEPYKVYDFLKCGTLYNFIENVFTVEGICNIGSIRLDQHYHTVIVKNTCC